ncbi:hypothetical protein CBS9595_002348 [Malassezia furfur]|nr:hypothetical protein CBS9595_002348 [Malassezia furfur]
MPDDAADPAPAHAPPAGTPDGGTGARTAEENVVTLHIASDDASDTSDPLPADDDESAEPTTLYLWDEDSDADDTAPPTPRPRARNLFAPTQALPTVANWWRTLLIGSAAPGTLSVGHVAMNLLGSSLHPGVLLAMPVYFTRAGVVPGIIVAVFVAVLAAFGAALWITLGRYVGGNTIEAITARAFGVHTQWRRNLGLGLSSAVLIVYCTGAAVVGYHAMTDLLLQVFFHYVRPGHLLHDRAFVTLFIGGTLPLLVSATPKRNMIQIQSWTMVLCYPVVVALLYAHTDDWETVSPPAHTDTVPMPRLHDYTWPWASTAMLPLLMLSALPAQILAHSRSMRRKTVYESNVRSFALAQFVQTASMLVIVYVLGADLGMVGSEQLGRGLHANFFDSLPFDDDHVNGARMLFAMMLAAHLCVCLASARSSWSRLLNLLNVHPLRNVQPPTPQRQSSTPSRFVSRASSFASPRWLPSPMRSSGLHLPPLDAAAALEERAWRRFRFLRNSLSGIVLWAITAGFAYFSGVGGVFRRNEKEGEELRFLRSVEIIGILGAIVGFLLPAVLWLVLFRIRRPRAILLFQSDSMRRRLSQYLLSPLSALIPIAREEETHSLLPHDEEEEAHDTHDMIPSHENEEGPSTRDEATLILLARKERALQRQTRENWWWSWCSFPSASF